MFFKYEFDPSWNIDRSNPVPKNNLSSSWKLAFALWVVNPDITIFDMLVVPSTLISPLTSNLLLGFATPSPTNCVLTSYTTPVAPSTSPPELWYWNSFTFPPAPACTLPWLIKLNPPVAFLTKTWPVLPAALFWSTIVPVSLISPTTWSSCVGFVVPIPTRPVFVTLNLEPLLISKALPIDNKSVESSNVSPVDVAKSPLSLNRTLLSTPGGATVIVAAIPKLLALTPIPLPTKFNCVILLKVPTNVPSSKTLIDPGINPPWIGTQNLSPGLESTDTIWNCVPEGTPGNDPIGFPKFGSAWSSPRYLYLSVVRPV